MGALAVRHSAASAALVRTAIADDLFSRAVHRDSIDDVLLVVSELIGNAIVHAHSSGADDLPVSWDVHVTFVVVEVRDGSRVIPARRRATRSDTGGRGLAIVAAIADDWGVQATADGKRVWARVPIYRA